jgi:ABC-2 type transport system ATP-binding protein
LHNLSATDYSEFISKFTIFFNEEIIGTKKYIRELSKGNQKKVGIAATFMASHDLNHVTEVCERIVLLEKGDILNDLKSDENALQTLKDYFQ